jgi:NAD(P)-dependent dehydrogenase (short-subunit alcohol dehydrogenase family)
MAFLPLEIFRLPNILQMSNSYQSSFSLAGKTILITGASSGIGQEAALTASQAGAVLIVTGRNQERLKDTFNRLYGQNHIMIAADLTHADEIAALIDELPEIDGIVHSAGITGHLPAKFIGPDDITSLFRINFEVPVLLTARILKKKKLCNGASVIFLSSIATRYPYFGGALYSSSKAALEAYSRTLAIELAPKGIRSNCISPSFVKTPMVQGAGETISSEVLEKFEKMMPLGFGEPMDVANAIIYLLADASKWITGSNMVLGGG